MRNLLAGHPFHHNAVEPTDVNGDGTVAPIDALVVVNRLNRPASSEADTMFTDVNNDQNVTPIDALMVVNRLNRHDGGNERGDNERGERTDRPPAEPPAPEIRSIDGTGNNLENPDWGSTDEQLLRTTTVDYEDGIDDPSGSDRPSARTISNAVAAQSESVQNDRNLTDLLWLFGQFVDHDIDLTVGTDPAEDYSIPVEAGEPLFDPFGTGEEVIALTRSIYDHDTGDSVDNPRQQTTGITAFLDGSVIYGSDAERADALRTFEGGQLATSEGDLLPFNTAGLDNAGGPSDTLFLAGDIRANENAALSAMHTVWIREHNRIAERIASDNPDLTDEQIYQGARARVTAQLQAITYNEFLPALLGGDAISTYSGYDADVNPNIANVFSTAAYRFGHSMLSSELLRLNNDGTVVGRRKLTAARRFFQSVGARRWRH